MMKLALQVGNVVEGARAAGGAQERKTKKNERGGEGIMYTHLCYPWLQARSQTVTHACRTSTSSSTSDCGTERACCWPTARRAKSALICDRVIGIEILE